MNKELSVLSIVVGVLLSVVFGAANAYLGLRVGMTVSASIPAAVIGMGVIKGIFRKNSVLESNMIQTIGSAGESLAAGAIFTMPALFMWADEGIMDKPNLFEITLIALFGGLLGILFMVPLRNALIVKEHGILPYPEGTACAKVMLAGEKGGSGAGKVFLGMGIAAMIKFVVDGLKVVSGVIVFPIKKLKTAFSVEVYPALVSVGYICGPKISSYMLSGGVLSWFVFIPLIGIFGAEAKLFPAENLTVAEVYATGGADAIWANYIKYIGAGAVAAGGIISLIKTLPLIFKTFADAMKGLKATADEKNSECRTEKELPFLVVLGLIFIIAILIWLVPVIPVNFVGAILIVIFGFFFATVSSRMVGLVGSSNNPVSGMAIATLLISTILLKATGQSSSAVMAGAIAIGSIICIVAAIAGDTSQDLKSGYILGATPRKQQIGEIIGVFAAALAIGGVLYLLSATGYGEKELPASQASLMKTIVEGVVGGELPWGLVFVGVFSAIFIEILGISILPVAIGMYLPLELSTTIMIGGIIRWFVEKKKYANKELKETAVNNGVLCCSGMIAGEGLVGILMAVFVVVKIGGKSISEILASVGSKLSFGMVGGAVVIALIVVTIFAFVFSKDKNDEE
ncbi:MAG: oligopeptide transporter, OPT family [Lachnospiraceae bacterium]|nr:oligopeptide transporter, OPT family [Lachnospiraceae bacterium]